MFRIQRLVDFVLWAIRILNLLLMLLERVREIVLLEMLLAVIGLFLEHAVVQIDYLISILLEALLQIKVIVVTIGLGVCSFLLSA